MWLLKIIAPVNVVPTNNRTKLEKGNCITSQNVAYMCKEITTNKHALADDDQRHTLYVSFQQLQHVVEKLKGSALCKNCCMVNCFLAVVVVFITPAGRRSGAAAGPASLTLQSGLAQESVVVRGSPGSLPSDPSHDACFHSEAEPTARHLSERLETSPLESGISADKLPGKVLMEYNCVYLKLHFKVLLQTLSST